MLAKLLKRNVDALEARQRPYEVRDTELLGLLIRVQPSGRRTFYCDFRLNGRRTRYRIGAYPNISVDGARKVAATVAGDVSRGVNPQERRKADREQAVRDRDATLKAFLGSRYEPWARAHLRSAAFQLARIRADFKNYLDKPLHGFNPLAVERIRRDWLKAGKAARTVNRDVQRLQSVLRRAVEEGVLTVPPLHGLKPLKTDKGGRVRFLTAGEEKALREALEDREKALRQARVRFNTWRVARGKKPLPEREGANLDHLRPLVLLALNTGLRRGELLGLTWGAMNLSAKMLTVTAATAKSGHTRRVPLNAEAASVLSAWHQRARTTGSDALVFPGRDGGRLGSVATAWRGLVKRAGIKNFRLHDCRHNFASRLVQSGVDLYTVKELLGHSEIAMTERYSHLAPDNLRAAVEKISA